MEWQKDYPSHTFDIVSPEFPSGSAWLVNCLLELDVPVWDLWGQKKTDEWLRLAPYEYRYQHPDLPWRQTLSSLTLNRVFNFDQSLSGRASHRWPTAISQGVKLILFVRDPRDMLFSQWRRNRFNLVGFEDSFEEFLLSRYYHYPVNNVDYLRFFWMLWGKVSKDFDHCIVKFEDYKNDPFGTLKKVLLFLGVDRDDQKVSNAVERSDFKVLKKIEGDLSAKGLLDRKFNFSSKSLEYKHHMSESVKKTFGCGLNNSCSWLGYELFESQEEYFFEMDDHWLENMIECVCGGMGNEAQRRRLESLFEIKSGVDLN